MVGWKYEHDRMSLDVVSTTKTYQTWYIQDCRLVLFRYCNSGTIILLCRILPGGGGDNERRGTHWFWLSQGCFSYFLSKSIFFACYFIHQNKSVIFAPVFKTASVQCCDMCLAVYVYLRFTLTIIMLYYNNWVRNNSVSFTIFSSCRCQAITIFFSYILHVALIADREYASDQNNCFNLTHECTWN